MVKKFFLVMITMRASHFNVEMSMRQSLYCLMNRDKKKGMSNLLKTGDEKRTRWILGSSCDHRMSKGHAPPHNIQERQLFIVSLYLE